MEFEWSQLVGVLIGGLLAIVGGALAPLIAARREHRHWRREKLAHSSEQLSAASLDAMIKFHDDRYMPPKRDIEDHDLQRMTASAGTMALSGSPQLAEAAFEVLDAYEALRMSAGEGAERRAELVNEMMQRGQKITIFTRRDLHLKHSIAVEAQFMAQKKLAAPTPALAEQAMERRIAKDDAALRRARRIRRWARVVVGIQALILLTVQARQRRRARRRGM